MHGYPALFRATSKDALRMGFARVALEYTDLSKTLRTYSRRPAAPLFRRESNCLEINGN
jgi:hypothetical protein